MPAEVREDILALYWDSFEQKGAPLKIEKIDNPVGDLGRPIIKFDVQLFLAA